MQKLNDPGPASLPGRSPEPSRESAGTRVKFWGVRGSIPAPGPNTAFYGGNTSCVEVRADDECIILDAGTGIRALGQQLRAEFRERPLRITILISHTHWDHIQGLPFFAPAYERQNHLRILAFEGTRTGLEETLSIQMESPYFPITIEELRATIEFQELSGMEFQIGPVRVAAHFMHHPGICAGYRLFTSAGSVVYLPDHELFGTLRNDPDPRKQASALDQEKKLRDFIHGADLVISDAQYNATEYKTRVGWGHSCVDDVVELSLGANVKELVLFHHDPDHTDDQVTQMLAGAREQVARNGAAMNIEAAREGCEITLQRDTPALP